MKFPYVREDTGSVRPLLRAAVSGTKRQASAQFLVDSGAEWTMMPEFLARLVGFKPIPNVRVDILDFAGRSAGSCEVAEFNFKFGGGRFEFRGHACIHPTMSTAIFGHRDLFLRYYVAFDSQKGLFIVDHYRRPGQASA